MARAAEVDDLDGAALGVDEEDVLGLEVAVYDVEVGRAQEHERRAQLLRELARQVERHTAEVGVAQKVVQVVGEELEDETQVVAEHEVSLEFHCNEKTSDVTNTPRKCHVNNKLHHNITIESTTDCGQNMH